MKIKDINPLIPATKLKPAIPAQKFKMWFTEGIFVVIRKMKIEIDYQNIDTKEIYHTTTSDNTVFFLVET